MNILQTIIQGFGLPYLVCATYEGVIITSLKIYPITYNGMVCECLDSDMGEFCELKDSLEEFLATLQPEEA